MEKYERITEPLYFGYWPDLMEKEKKMKYCYIDVETGGTDPVENPLLQISGMIEIISDKGTTMETFNWFIKPLDYEKVDPKALAVNNLTLEQLEGFTSSKTIYSDFKSLLGRFIDPYNPCDKLFFVGYNSHGFDMPFVREWFTKHKDPYFGSWFFYPSIDVMILAAEKLKAERRMMKNFKLSTVATKLGIKVDSSNLHDALYDVELTRKVYKEVIK